MDSKKNQELGVGASQKSNLLLAVSMLVAGLLVGGFVEFRGIPGTQYLIIDFPVTLVIMSAWLV